MIRKFILLLCCVLFTGSVAWADQEVLVKLDRQGHETQTVDLGYAAVTFHFTTVYNNQAQVEVSVENLTPSQTVLLFNSTQDEKMLKKRKPKVLFEKTYGGEKGHRFVSGCRNVKNIFERIEPAETRELFVFEGSVSEPSELLIPFYIAKYVPRGFLRSAKYRILREDNIKFILEIDGWSELDPTYVGVKRTISDFKARLKNVKFCGNKMHKPSLVDQQRLYQAIKDSMILVIDSIFKSNPWMSQDLPHQAYTRLKQEIESVNLDEYVSDCGKHKRVHRCGYCSLSTEQIYHRLDDTYQRLHTGRITKDEAVKTARALHNCYHQNRRRGRDSFYSGKINDYYERIINF